MDERLQGPAAIKAAVDEYETQQFNKYRFIESLSPFKYPQLDEISLEVLGREYPPLNEDPGEKETRDSFRKHLESLSGISTDNIVEIRQIFSQISKPIVGGKVLVDVTLTVGDLKKIPDRHLNVMGLSNERAHILKRLFPRS